MADLRAQITESMINKIKSGNLIWRAPKPNPFNPVSKTRYSGINHLLLRDTNFTDPRFMTFRQAKEIGTFVRKDEKGTKVIKYVEVEIGRDHDQDAEDEEFLGENGRKAFVLRQYNVFNVSQLDSFLTPLEINVYDSAQCEQMLQAFKATGLRFNDRSTQCYYSMSEDMIAMINPRGFDQHSKYHAVLLHELAHSTMHMTRLDRTVNTLDKKEYAKEELRAEIASSYIYAEMGLEFDPLHDNDHACYVAYYADILEESISEIFKASTEASMISNYCLDITKKFKNREYSFCKENDTDGGFQAVGGHSLAEAVMNQKIKQINKDTELTSLKIKL